MRIITAFTLAGALLPLSAPTGATEMEQTLVTATRTPELARLLPLAWTRLDASAIDFTGQVHISELMQQVPGAWISRGNGQESLTALRSPVLTGAGGCGAFFIAGDGISLRAPGFCNINQLFDANTEQAGLVEVIKGPATALFGSNAMHGVINILSAPPPSSLDHRIALEAGPDDYYRVKYRYGNTLGQHGVSIRANGTSDGGYKHDSGYDQQKVTARHDFSSDEWSTTTVLDYSNLNQETAGYITGYEAYEDGGRKRENPNPEAYRDARALRLYSKISLQLDDDNRVSLTPYLRDNDMDFLQHFLPWQSVEKNGHSSFGLRGDWHHVDTNWNSVAGLELDYTEGWLKETQDEPFSPNQPAGVHYDYDVDAINTAAFGQLSYAPGASWRFSTGARYEYSRYDYDNRTDDGPACDASASACRFYRPADRRDSFNDWSFNAGASYDVSQQAITYARLARGFRAPQATELYRLQAGQQVADLDSEAIDSIEFGLRGTAIERINYDISLYAMEKSEVIFQDSNRQNVSGADTRHRGLDLELEYAFADDWTLSFTGNYARHEYASRIDLLGSSTDIKGNTIDTAPRLFGSARLGWNTAHLTGLPGRAELEWVYMDEYYLDPDNEHEYSGHSLLNLRLNSELGRRLAASLRVTNLLDEDYAERADFGFGSYRYFVGQPRSAYIELSYRLGRE